jgi:hypothetical protein
MFFRKKKTIFSPKNLEKSDFFRIKLFFYQKISKTLCFFVKNEYFIIKKLGKSDFFFVSEKRLKANRQYLWPGN